MEEPRVTDFLSQNSLWIVLLVVLVVWIGILGYLFRIERRVKQLENETKPSLNRRGEGA
jgi:CcmD family protein